MRPDLVTPGAHPWIPDGPNPILAALHKIIYLGGSIQWLGNFSLFIPVAWLLAKSYPKLSHLKILLICTSLSASIEIIHGATKTMAGVRQVPYFGYFKEFPRTRVPIAKALEPYGVTIHSLRKTYAYFLKSNNVHVTTAAKFMGHSNPLVTLKIYTLVRDDEINLVGDELRKVLTFSPDLVRDTNDMLTQSHLAMR
ncbi:MAG: hypothetical protein WCQ52_01860 [Actinomycetes bacterium]